MNFLDKLDFLMKRDGISKKGLSEKSGVPYTTIDSFYKKGYGNAKLSTIEKIATAFNTSIDYLMRENIIDPRHGMINNDFPGDKDSYSVHETLVALKKQSGLTTQEISDKSGVPVATLSKIFAGQTKAPQLDTMRAVVHALGYSLDDLDDAPSEKHSLTNEEDNLLKSFRLLSPEGKAYILQTVDMALKSYRKSDEGQRGTNSNGSAAS